MLNLVQSVKVAAWLYRTPLDHDESYNVFREKFTATYTGTHLSERQVREAYDKWRRNRIENEVIAEVSSRARTIMWSEFIKGKARRVNLAAMLAVTLAILCPPGYLPVGDTQISTGFEFVFVTQVGRIDSPFLICEFVAIAIIWWLAQKLFVAQPTRVEA